MHFSGDLIFASLFSQFKPNSILHFIISLSTSSFVSLWWWRIKCRCSDLLRPAWWCPVWRPEGSWSLCNAPERDHCRHSHQRTTSHRAPIRRSGSATGSLSSHTSDTSSHWGQRNRHSCYCCVGFFNRALRQKWWYFYFDSKQAEYNKTNSEGWSKAINMSRKGFSKEERFTFFQGF